MCALPHYILISIINKDLAQLTFPRACTEKEDTADGRWKLLFFPRSGQVMASRPKRLSQAASGSGNVCRHALYCTVQSVPKW